MPIVPTIKTLCRIPGVDVSIARIIRKALKEERKSLSDTHLEKHYPITYRWVQACYNRPSPMEIGQQVVAELLGGGYYEWHPLRGTEWVSHYWQETAALYLPCQDSYDETLVYEVERDRYLVRCIGDYIEQQEKKGILLK